MVNIGENPSIFVSLAYACIIEVKLKPDLLLVNRSPSESHGLSAQRLDGLDVPP